MTTSLSSCKTLFKIMLYPRLKGNKAYDIYGNPINS